MNKEHTIQGICDAVNHLCDPIDCGTDSPWCRYSPEFVKEVTRLVETYND